MQATERSVICGPFVADCTEPPYCVAVAGMDDDTIRITSTIPDHDGAIYLSRAGFDEMSRIIAAADPMEIFVFGRHDPVTVTQNNEDTYLEGPDGNGGKAKILFYHGELLNFYHGIRCGEIAEKLQPAAA